MAAKHPPILQGAPVTRDAHRHQRAAGALSPEFIQGAVSTMRQHAAGAAGAVPFGLGGVDDTPRHHRAAGPGGVASIWTPAGGVFLARACAVVWEQPGRVAVDLPHYADLAPTRGLAPDDIDGTGAYLDGSWLNGADPYSQWGRAYTAMREDDDRAPYQPPPPRSAVPLVAAIVAAAGLVLVACLVTSDGGFYR